MNAGAVEPTPLDLAAIEARANAATAPPWEVGDGWVYTSPVWPYDTRLSNVLGMKFADHEQAAREKARVEANVEFIAHARADIPALLAEVAALRAQRDDDSMAAALILDLTDEVGRLRAQVAAPDRDALVEEIERVRVVDLPVVTVDDAAYGSGVRYASAAEVADALIAGGFITGPAAGGVEPVEARLRSLAPGDEFSVRGRLVAQETPRIGPLVEIAGHRLTASGDMIVNVAASSGIAGTGAPVFTEGTLADQIEEALNDGKHNHPEMWDGGDEADTMIEVGTASQIVAECIEAGAIADLRGVAGTGPVPEDETNSGREGLTKGRAAVFEQIAALPRPSKVGENGTDTATSLGWTVAALLNEWESHRG